MTAFEISFGDVALSLILMALAIAVSRSQRLGLEKNLAIGTVRTFVQLTLIGFALRILFQASSPWVFFAVVAVMLTVASYECVRRQDIRLPHFFFIALGSLGLALAVSLGVVVALIIRPDPWFNLVVTIPLSGMVLGNGMNVISLSANRFLSELHLRRDEVEVALSLAAPPRQALHPAFKNAVTGAMIPSVNALMTVGLVQLPGVMTGQILAGISPVEAVKFQIVIMMMWVTTGVLSGVTATLLLMASLVNRRWQVRWERIPGS
ncbi:MAG: iron export ABC transporter permease subunit FetB [Candidatus Marinimicrobia bacterium]|nr:iron export ABC transporter permease subunit FetB [Candidatus Neomarinimicrobiota bacterium]